MATWKESNKGRCETNRDRDRRWISTRHHRAESTEKGAKKQMAHVMISGHYQQRSELERERA